MSQKPIVVSFDFNLLKSLFQPIYFCQLLTGMESLQDKIKSVTWEIMGFVSGIRHLTFSAYNGFSPHLSMV